MAELDQAHRVGRLVGGVGPEPDQGVEGLAVPVVDVAHDVAGLGPQAADPEVAGLGEVVEPGEAEGAQVGQDQRPGRQPGQHRAGRDLLVLAGIGLVGDAAEELGAHVEEGAQLARQQGVGAPLDVAQGGQGAGDLVEGGLVEGDHRRGERGQGRVGVGGEAVGQEAAHPGEERLQRAGPVGAPLSL